MNCSMPSFLVLHYIPGLLTHVHWVSDVTQLSHPLLPPSPLALNLSQHQSLSQWVSSLHQVVKVLELQLQHQSFQGNIGGWFPLGLTGLISLLSTGLSRVFFNTTVRKHQFCSTPSSLWSNFHIHTWLLLETSHSFDHMGLCWQSDISAF